MADDFTPGNDPAPSFTSSATGNGGATSGQTATVDAPAAGPSQTEQYRDAYERLQRGESPTAVNQAVMGGNAQRDPAQPAASAPAGQATATSTTNPAAPASAADVAKNRGLSETELNALRRGKIDITETHWGSVPSSNLKALAKSLATSQSEADRAFQAQRQGVKPGAATGAAAGAAAPKPGEAAPAAAGDPAAQQTAGTAGDPAAQPAAGQGESDAASTDAGNRALTNVGDFFQKLPALPDATRQTLVALGGEDLATQVETANAHVFEHVRQQFQPLIAVMNNVAGMLQQRDFDEGLASLAKEPGFGSISDEQRQAIQDKAAHLLRASDAPLSTYSMRDAVKDAGRVLLSTNVTQNAQAQLLARREQSLNGSPDKGTTRTASPQARLSGSALTAEVAKRAQGGKSFAAARAELEAEGLV